jgi:uncharacterized membrane-anchored protein
VLGLVVPKAHALSDDGSWAVVVTYSDDGYVSDSEAARHRYAESCEDMQEHARGRERSAQGSRLSDRAS